MATVTLYTDPETDGLVGTITETDFVVYVEFYGENATETARFSFRNYRTPWNAAEAWLVERTSELSNYRSESHDWTIGGTDNT